MFLLLLAMLNRPCSEVKWKSPGFLFLSPVPPSLPLPCVTVCSQISTGLYNSYMYTETAKTIGVNTECTNFGGQKCASISFFFIEAPNICRSSVWKIYVVRKFEVCFEFCEKKVVHPALIYCPQHFT